MGEKYNIKVDDVDFEVEIEEVEGHFELRVAERTFRISMPENTMVRAPERSTKRSKKSDGVIFSTIPGKIVTVEVSIGQTVNEGDICLVLEAMKMQNEIAAPVTGVVTEINCSGGMTIEANLPLIVIEPIQAN